MRAWIFDPKNVPAGNVILALSPRQAEVLQFLAGRTIAVPKGLREAKYGEPIIGEVEDLQEELQYALERAGVQIAG